jgi:hypothetical protein
MIASKIGRLLVNLWRFDPDATMKRVVPRRTNEADVFGIRDHDQEGPFFGHYEILLLGCRSRSPPNTEHLIPNNAGSMKAGYRW